MAPIPYETLEKADIGALKAWYEKHGNILFYDEQGEGKAPKFNANYLALYICRVFPTITLMDIDKIWQYNEKTGNYEIEGEKIINVIIQQMFKEHYTERIYKQTIAAIRPISYIKREKFTLALNLIPVKNGLLLIPAKNSNNPKTWNFKDIHLLKNSPKYYVTNRIQAKYNPKRDCPKFKEFLNQVIPPDAILFLQEYVGYILYRGFPYHKAVLLTGPTSTGKSTFIRIITEFIGKGNQVSIAIQDLRDKNQRVRLYQKLLNTQADISQTGLKDSAWFKQITGNDYISAERKYEQGFEFIPFAKHIWSCNRIPAIYDESDAFFGRLRIINMNLRQHLPNDAETNHHLLEMLTSSGELSGILNWALEGLERLLKQGHFTNDHPASMTREIWASQSDPISKFMYSEWVQLNGSSMVSKDDLWDHFQFFCKCHDIVPVSRNGFFKEMNVRYVAKGLLSSTRPFDRDSGEQVYSFQGLGLNLPKDAVEMVNNI